MRIAVPVDNGKLSQHFGHCEWFELFDVDDDSGAVLSEQTLKAPEHEPGLLPKWLAAQEAQVVVTGGMGNRARTLFGNHGIKVIAGAASDEPRIIVQHYLAGTLETNDTACDH